MNANDAADLALNSPRILDIVGRFGSAPVTAAEKAELIELGFVEAKADNIAPGGQIFVMTPLGRLAGRAARLAEIVREGWAA
tara:strand:+ start:1036 stop:1281 length:246 start_codon:yes stop_codon:yes gene_type:complete